MCVYVCVCVRACMYFLNMKFYYVTLATWKLLCQSLALNS